MLRRRGVRSKRRRGVARHGRHVDGRRRWRAVRYRIAERRTRQVRESFGQGLQAPRERARGRSSVLLPGVHDAREYLGSGVTFANTLRWADEDLRIVRRERRGGGARREK